MLLWTPWSSELGDTVGFTVPRSKAVAKCFVAWLVLCHSRESRNDMIQQHL
ncbi:MAG: hypothetical protein ACEY3D_08010 [Rickettsia sp.]|uniref:hypothetical protein n=1 Tax=Rickettsia sp. TaxID=789 RepID=UPI00397CF542